MADSKTALDKVRILKNKVAMLLLDVQYKGAMYRNFYTMTAKIRGVLRKAEESSRVLNQIEALVDEYENNDEAFYREWDAKSKDLKRSQKIKKAAK